MKTKKTQSKSSKLSVGQKLKESSQLYLLMLPSIIIFLIFTYYPMYVSDEYDYVHDLQGTSN